MLQLHRQWSTTTVATTEVEVVLVALVAASRVVGAWQGIGVVVAEVVEVARVSFRIRVRVCVRVQVRVPAQPRPSLLLLRQRRRRRLVVGAAFAKESRRK